MGEPKPSPCFADLGTETGNGTGAPRVTERIRGATTPTAPRSHARGGGALAAGAVSAGVRVAGPRPGRSGDPRVPRPFGSRDAERKRADLASPRLDLLQDECFLLLLNFLTLRFFFFFVVLYSLVCSSWRLNFASLYRWVGAVSVDRCRWAG